MQTAAYSNDKEVAEELLSYFVDIGNKECFAAMLYMCFDLLSPDFVEELSWQHGLNDFFMPYKIQLQRSLVQKVAALEKQVQELSTKTQKKEQAEEEASIIPPGGFGNRLLLTQGNGYPPQGPPPPMMMNGTGMPMQTGIPSVSFLWFHAYGKSCSSSVRRLARHWFWRLLTIPFRTLFMHFGFMYFPFLRLII